MALRMAEYSLRIYRQFKNFPRQVVLYVGEPAVCMKTTLHGPGADPDLTFRYTLFDFRELDGGSLLRSRHIEDNILAILARLKDQAATVHQILQRVANLEEPERPAALAQFLVISGLRHLEQTIKEEAKKMPILNDILSHKVIGPAILQGREEGRQEGRQEILHNLIEKRFGPIPESLNARINLLTSAELDAMALRLLDITRLEDLFK